MKFAVKLEADVNIRHINMGDFYTRYCKKCGLEIIEKGDCVTMTANSKFCECNQNNTQKTGNYEKQKDKKQEKKGEDANSLMPASPFVLSEHLDKLKVIERQLELFREDISGYGKFIERNIRQGKEIIELEKVNLTNTEKELIIKELKFVLNYREKDAETSEMALSEDYVNKLSNIINKLTGDLAK